MKHDHVEDGTGRAAGITSLLIGNCLFVELFLICKLGVISYTVEIFKHFYLDSQLHPGLEYHKA